jgi:predicted NAD/FAD-binding protein
MTYTHPILDGPAVAAQPQVAALSGARHTYFCGAYLGHGFHEDGFVSALKVAEHLGVRW